MALDKVFHKIQILIQELAPTLELFVDESIQPSVNDCENLQKQLSDLQEDLAVYKYQKLNKEISPSFNIHAKLSATKVAEEIKVETVPEPVVPAPAPITEVVVENTEPVKEIQKPSTIQPKAALLVGLNDKFRFVNELFAQNNSEYLIAIEQLNNMANWQDSENYLSSLKNLYGWKETAEVVRYFYSLVKKRFD